MSKHIMVVNDTQEILELFREILEGEGGYKTSLYTYEPHILKDVKEIKPDLIISDHMFGEDKLGWQFIQKVKMDRATENIPLIVCTGAVREVRELEGFLTQKNIGVVIKPFNVDDLLEVVRIKLKDGPKEKEGHSKPKPKASNKE